MNKERLIELGVAEDVVEKVLQAHKATIDGNYVTKSRFNEVNDELNIKKTEVEDRDTQLEELRKVDPEKLQTQIDTLQADNKKKEEDYQKELKRLKVKHAAERQVTELKALDLTSVLAHVDLAEADLNDDGTVQGLKERLATLKEEKAFLFEADKPDESESKKPGFKGAEPGQPKDKTPGGKPDLSKMTFEQYTEWYESQNK